MHTSETVDQLFAALAAAQAEIQNPNKTKTAKVKGTSKTGASYEMTYKYADIADVLTDARPVLAKHGLCVVQATGVDSGAMFLRTRIAHASGQWVESEYPVAALNADHQKMGAALTYARRYALCAMIGVAAEEDTDGQDAAEPVGRGQRREPRREETPQVDWADVAYACKSALLICATETEANAWKAGNEARINAMPTDLADDLVAAYKAHVKELRARAQEDAQ